MFTVDAGRTGQILPPASTQTNEVAFVQVQPYLLLGFAERSERRLACAKVPRDRDVDPSRVRVFAEASALEEHGGPRPSKDDPYVHAPVPIAVAVNLAARLGPAEGPPLLVAEIEELVRVIDGHARNVVERGRARSMIGRLMGKASMQADGTALVDVGGVGYEVQVPLGTVGRAGLDAEGRITLYVHTHAREDALTLFGFATEADRVAFRTLIGISSVGPKTALSVLGSLPAEALSQAIAHKDLAVLTEVPGIGKKTAERMVLELTGKLPTTGRAAVALAPPPSLVKARTADLLAGALTRMGYRTAETDRAIAALGDRVESAPLPELVREALAFLAK